MLSRDDQVWLKPERCVSKQGQKAFHRSCDCMVGETGQWRCLVLADSVFFGLHLFTSSGTSLVGHMKSFPRLSPTSGNSCWTWPMSLQSQGSLWACGRWRMSLRSLMSLPREQEMRGRGAQEMAWNLHLKKGWVSEPVGPSQIWIYG